MIVVQREAVKPSCFTQLLYPISCISYQMPSTGIENLRYSFSVTCHRQVPLENYLFACKFTCQEMNKILFLRNKLSHKSYCYLSIGKITCPRRTDKQYSKPCFSVGTNWKKGTMFSVFPVKQWRKVLLVIN